MNAAQADLGALDPVSWSTPTLAFAVAFRSEPQALEGPERRTDRVRKSKFSEEQIAMALRQAEAGTSVAQICRKLGISQSTFFRWKKM